MWGGHEGMGWWMVLGSVWFVLFWGIVIWVVVKLAGGPRSDAGSEHQRPIEIARRRYASGEITKDQFDEIRRDLGET
ncbi:MAG TPA: SHOCT domain-containing protein [Dehalococcoidia bacterium]|nr:SHOCT domain-containing protein [Dehalococcoidia bacterium]